VQIEAVIRLCRDIVKRNGIPSRTGSGAFRYCPDAQAGSRRDVSLGQALIAEGIGHWVEPLPVGGGRFFQEGDSGQPVEALQTMLALYGYGLEVDGVYSSQTTAVVRAFQRHFRPARVDGIADASTIGTLHKLLSELPGVA
jgi:N-acetylmuramoyl-L-alanine amidase